MRWGGGTGLEVRIQAGFENDSLASWRKIPEQKSLHFTCGEDAGPWAYLLPTVFVSTVNTGHSCCAASVQAQPPVCGGVAFAKAKRNFHQQSDVLFYPCKMQSKVAQGWFLHTNTLPPAHVFFSGSAAVKDYSSSPCITGEGFPNLCSGGKDGWCPLPGSKREQGFPEEGGEERLGGSCHPLQVTVTLPPTPWWLLPGVCTVWTWIQLIVN